MWQVVFHPDAETDLGVLPPRERVAMLHAVDKLRAAGPLLPFPHQSGVQGVEKLRELRPRAGRSPWRGFYRRVGDAFVIAAVGPEADADRRGFDRATANAIARLEDVEVDGGTR